MKKWLSLIVAATLLLCACARAELDDWAGEWIDDFGLDPFDEGYDGTWVQVDALDFEFCLPDGWAETEPSPGAAFSATNGTSSLSVRPVAGNVSDLAAWAAANLKKYNPCEANFYDVLVVEDKNALSAYLIISDENLVAFDFSRGSEDALPLSFALQIVGSACALWDDADVPIMEGDDGFDFGAAFEEDLG